LKPPPSAAFKQQLNGLAAEILQNTDTTEEDILHCLEDMVLRKSLRPSQPETSSSANLSLFQHQSNILSNDINSSIPRSGDGDMSSDNNHLSEIMDDLDLFLKDPSFFGEFSL
jgi:hypothetical protein